MTGGQRGFTLVEMLVSLAIAALLVSLAYGAIRVGQRSVNALDRQVEQAEIMRIGWQFVHNTIAHAVPAADPARPGSGTGFEGGSERLVFIAKMPSYVGIEGTMRITLATQSTGDGDQLLLTRERLDDEFFAPDGESLEQAVLVEDLDQLDIEYFGQSGRGTEPVWQGIWDNPRRLPNLIRIQVKPADGEAWPELTAAPQEGTAPLDEGTLPSYAEETEPPEDATP